MMKRTLFSLLLCAALLASPAAQAAAPSAAPSAAQTAAAAEILQTAKEANLRKQASTRSDLLERLKQGSRVEVISRMDVDGERWA